ncbi:MAG: hypothetical protein OSJ70_01745 [Bacilli bacterium]|nr:hypothetical protein [Bacilli bacterium]
MKKLDKIYATLIILLILMLCVTFSLPHNIIYKIIPEFILLALIFSVVIVIPCIYIFRDFKNHLIGVLATVLYFTFTNTIFLIMILIFSNDLHIINPFFIVDRYIETKGKCLYILDEDTNGYTYKSSAYRSKFFLFYESIGTNSEC